MAQARTSGSPSLSTTSDPSPQSEATKLSTTDTATNVGESNTEQKSHIILPTSDAPEEPDDEVQFIFSAPRRRKKKRRRLESSLVSKEEIQSTKATRDPQKALALPGPLRRGTTGMVQELESCHIGDIDGKAGLGLSRSGSLPIVAPIAVTSPSSKPSTIHPPKPRKLTPQFLPFAPFMSMPRWTDLSTQPQDSPMAQNDWVPMKIGDKLSNKRKRKGELCQPLSHRSQPSLDEQLPSKQSQQSAFSEVDGMSLKPLKTFLNCCPSPPINSSTNASSLHSKMRNFCPTPHSNTSRQRSQAPTMTITKSNTSDSLGPNNRTLQRDSIEVTSSTLPHHTITVPARLVPEQSVSPRTQTVEIPRPSLANQAQARQIMMLQQATIPSHQSMPSPPTHKGNLLVHQNSQSQVPRSTPVQEVPSQGFQSPQNNSLHNRPQNLRTYPSDIVRKPSLYKVPPWPSPPSSITSSQMLLSTSEPPTLTMKASNFNGSMNNGIDSGVNGFSVPQHSNIMNAPGLAGHSLLNSPINQIGKPLVIPPQTQPQQCSTRSSPPSSSPGLAPPQVNSNKRKYSPNLIVDIAETCQEHFPFAAVAERHKIPIQKVFDTFSAIIQLPLLRSASDNRRHGSLGKRRMKEFRDARKAMENEMKDKSADTSTCIGRGKKNARKGPQQPLLRAALLNNAARGSAL